MHAEAQPLRQGAARARPGHLRPVRDASDEELEAGLTLEDFYAYMVTHQYICAPTRDLWPAASVNARLTDQLDGKASTWLDQNRAVDQMTWMPGAPMVIEGRLFDQGGWIDRPGCSTFNLYRPPTIEPGDAAKAGLWVEHVRRVFPAEADHILAWLAHRVQRPHEKVNHALVLQGPPGVGKDTIIEGAIRAVGPWNVKEAAPDQLLGRFNPHVKSVILRVSEARDLGDSDRYRLYDHTKTLIAAPPETLSVDEKNVRHYAIPNVVGVVITTNYRDGIYLPADDRRHFVAWTELTKDDFGATDSERQAHWTRLYGWYESGGYEHIAAYLAEYDLSGFNPKAPPPKTDAFWAVVDAGRAPEDAELSDALERLQYPQAVTLSDLVDVAAAGFGEWLQDRRNSRQIPHRMEAVGYVRVRNDGSKDGRWKVGGKNQVVYAQRELTVRDRIAAVRYLVEAQR